MKPEMKSGILLVHIDEGLLEIYSRLLRSCGHDVFTAADCAEALAIARSRRPDLVLLGVLLPDPDSVEICRRLKADPALNDPHIIVLSNSVDNAESLFRMLEGGADDYIALPVTNKELLARIKVQLRLKYTLSLLKREVEAHRATQIELCRSESFLHLICESIADVLWLITPGFDRVVYVGPAFEAIWGLECATVYNQPGMLLDAVHPEDRQRVSATFADYARGIAQDYEYRIVRPDGSIRWIHERTAPIREAGGSISLIAGISRDVTVEKQLQAQASLLESEARLRQLAENLRQVIWLRDRDRMLYVSPAFEEVWGLPLESIYRDYTSFMDCVHPEDRERVRRALLRERECEAVEEEFRITHSDGALRWLRVDSVPIHEAGEVVGTVGITQDITAHKAAEDALRLREQELRQGREYYRLLAGKLIRAQEEERRRLARELHDDLSQRVAYLAIEAGRLAGEAASISGELRQKLSELREYAAELAQDIGNLSRLIHPAVLEELGLVEAVRSECRKFKDAFAVPVQFRSPPSFPEPGKETAICLYRFLQEALRNIGKHARANRVTISLDSHGEDLCLTVTDDGVGFDPGSARKKGGLGLAGMAERVALLQGILTIDSQPGSGAILRACVPART